MILPSLKYKMKDLNKAAMYKINFQSTTIGHSKTETILSHNVNSPIVKIGLTCKKTSVSSLVMICRFENTHN